MSIVKNNVVSIEYTVKDKINDEVVDSNVDGKPLEFIVGQEQIIPGLENKILGLNKNDKADIEVIPADGYGEYNDDAVQVLPKEQFAGVELSKGLTLYGNGENGETVQVIVKDFTDDEVTIDYNHPLAGKTLLFTIEILDVREATEEELSTGAVGGMAAGGCCGSGSCDDDHNHDETTSNESCSGNGSCS